MARKPAPVPVHTINRLFWQKFPYCVEIDFATASITATWANSVNYQGYQKSHSKIGDKVKKFFPTDKTHYKLVRTYNVWKVYFLNEADQDSFVASMVTMKKDVKTTGKWKPESTEHLDLLKEDHKLVTRDSLFYQKYTWKITFKPAYKLENKDELVTWIQEMYMTDDVEKTGNYYPTWSSNRYRFAEGNHTPVLYLQDDDDVVIAKLIYSSSIKKIEKAVILNQNNNNKGITDEPSTVSQIG